MPPKSVSNWHVNAAPNWVMTTQGCMSMRSIAPTIAAINMGEESVRPSAE
jgi:hypothetical protein